MCGILAIFNDFSENIYQKGEAAINLLAHRGPNDLGIWASDGVFLAHRRLSIIDTSSAGHQPMRDDESGVVLIFNGEIYNYIELKAQLELLGHKFSGHSDTEVLLHSYLEWGSQCVQYFNGDWAFVVWDPRNGSAFISRDRFSIKPLYFSRLPTGIAIASEPKAILEIYPQFRKVNEYALLRFLKESALYDQGESFYEGVELFRPAHNAVYELGSNKMSFEKYWDWPKPENAVEGDIQEKFNSLLEDSIRIRMRSDVPVGITLSGGLDSTAVASVAARLLVKDGARTTAYTSVYEKTQEFENIDEREWAEKAAEKCDYLDLKHVCASRDRWLPTLRKVVRFMDGPGYSPAVVPLWSIAEIASQDGVSVLLEGQGADELLGGYTDYAAALFIEDFWRLFFAFQWTPLYCRLAGFVSVFGWKFFFMRVARLVSPKIKNWNQRSNGVLGTLRSDLLARHASIGANQSSLNGSNSRISAAEREMRMDFSSRILPGLLQYGDSISMAHSVESRLPFLDYRLVEFCAQLPIEWKIKNGETKFILRQYLRTIGQIDIANRMDKKGYPTPIRSVFKKNDGRFLRELLLAPNARINKYCESSQVLRLIEKFVAGNDRAENPLYRLVSAELWLQECIAE